MLIEHEGRRPRVDPSAWIVPTAVVGGDVRVGPHALLNGVVVEDDAFIATGAAVFPGARVGAGAEVRIHGVVHVNSVLPPGGLVPIGWVAVGNPAQVFPPERHEEIWAIQETLDFPGTAFGLSRDTPDLAAAATRPCAEAFGRHRRDRVHAAE